MIAWIRAQNWSAVDFVSSLAPWLAPLPTAWLVYDRTQHHLNWPQWVAAIAGITLELLGVGILATWLMLYGYNRNKRKSDPAAVMWLPVGLVVLYVLTAEALTVVLDVWPAMATIAPALFPILSVAAFALLALRANHVRRLDDIAWQKDERKRQRDERKRHKDEERRQELDHERRQMEARLQEVESWTKAERVGWYAMQYPDWTRAQLMEAVGCSLSTVNRALATDNGRKPQEVEREQQQTS